MLPDNVKFSRLTCRPNAKEGGVFIQYECEYGSESELLSTVRKNLREKRLRSWFSMIPVSAFAVKGVPFIHDMIGRAPSRILKVEFEGPDIHLETLYDEFREFGRLLDIRVLSPSSKDLPRYATVEFYTMRSACAARNCLHGMVCTLFSTLSRNWKIPSCMFTTNQKRMAAGKVFSRTIPACRFRF